MLNYKHYYLFFLAISIFLFILGFFLNENSAGGGSFIGDIKIIWKNLQIFINNSLTSSLASEEYVAGRTPIAPLLHKYFNPFINNLESFRLSVFFISILLPFFLFFTLNYKFKNNSPNVGIFVTSILLLSPYFRTSSYWALEENYGLIFLIITYFFLYKFFELRKNKKKKINLKYVVLICFFSSLTFYFDQKLIVVPLICFLYIFLRSNFFLEKFLTIVVYFLCAIPYIYLIKIWGSIIPTAASSRALNFDTVNIGYTISIIAFYVFPFLITKEITRKRIVLFFSLKENIALIIIIFLYLVLFLLVFDNSIKWVSGNGVFYKISLVFFEDILFQKFFLAFIIFFSFIVLIYFFKTKHDRLIILYFLILSLVVTPVYQEYLDPLILLMMFTFFKEKIYLNLNFKKALYIYAYFMILLIGSNLYYYNILSIFY